MEIAKEVVEKHLMERKKKEIKILALVSMIQLLNVNNYIYFKYFE